ncbi:DnaB-like helicase C-terminal domain-containing protein [Xanthomonas populi]|uniref:DnaB-like helicase C-terminal domain-containing protein n=1 Tax=Xanthomonas populi TaxID=53414 RepID=UPI0013049767|nr:DnaB-like helicase C-terminal domain-containing protein [Xanthomonas populi]
METQRSAHPKADAAPTADAQAVEQNEAVSTTSRVPVAIEPALARWFDSMQGRFSEPEHPDYSTGYRELDQLVAGGLHAEDLIVIGGRPSSGKTPLALGLSQHVSFKRRRGVAFFTPESTADQVASRLVASLSGVELSAVRSGRVMDDDWNAITSAVRLLKQAQIWIDDTPGLTPDMLRGKVLQLQKEKGDISLVVVDNLQQMRVPCLRSNRAAEVAEIARSLKEIAKEAKVTGVATSHLVRPTERNYSNGYPALTDLRDSGAIEDVADVVIMLHQRKAGSENTDVIVAKQKHGPSGSFQLRFIEATSRMESYRSIDEIATAKGLSDAERNALAGGHDQMRRGTQ